MRMTLAFAVAAVALLAVAAMPLHSSPAAAGTITCKQAAKAKYPNNLFKRMADRRACRKAWKAHKA
jgi:hypothetical protein